MHDTYQDPFAIDLNAGEVIYQQAAPPAGDTHRLSLYQKSIHSLPVPPALWNAFQQACNRGASGQQLAEIIKEDPVLSAAILRSANSAMFGLRTPINDVGRAISHLGFSLVRSIVASHAFSSKHASTGKVYNIQELWKHGMAVSVLAEIIAHYIPGCDAEEAGTLGLFHDIGKISFNMVTEYMRPANLDPEKGFLVYEHERFGCTHIDMGEALARHWELPDKIRQGIKYHHHPAYAEAESIPAEIRAEVLAVYLADLISITLGLAGGCHGYIPPHKSFASMLPNTTLNDILNEKHVRNEMARIEGIEF